MIVLGASEDAPLASALEQYLYVGGWMSLRTPPQTIREFTSAPDDQHGDCFAIFIVASDGRRLQKKLAQLRAITSRPLVAVFYLATTFELRDALCAGASDVLDFSRPLDAEIRSICCRILTGSRHPNRAFRLLGDLPPQDRRLALLHVKCAAEPQAAPHLLQQAETTDEAVEKVRRKLSETLGADLGLLLRAA